MKREAETKSNEDKQETKQNLVKSMHKIAYNKGITLIALVVTIVILLILAAVSITAVFGENGLIEMARRAAEATNEAIETEQEDISELENFLGNHLAGGGTPTPTLEPTPIPKLKISGLMSKPSEQQVSTENQDVEDAYGNPVTIPAGFKIVPNGNTHVTYTYTGDNIPSVQDGIVIEDAEGNEYGEKNQFVWVPVGTINNKEGEPTTITLGRYTFDYSNGTEHLVQNSVDYANTDESTKIFDYYQELEHSSYGNVTAKNLQQFVTKTNEKGGYWIARYEAVKGQDEKVKSMQSIKVKDYYATGTEVGCVWTAEEQSETVAALGTMYVTNENFEIDLVNSYAWDTALVFIQTYSKGNEKYGVTCHIADYFFESECRTGEGTTKMPTDMVCNIYDLGSDKAEWSTETSNREEFYILRGADIQGRSGNESPDSRSDHYEGDRGSNIWKCTFRAVLYLIN